MSSRVVLTCDRCSEEISREGDGFRIVTTKPVGFYPQELLGDQDLCADCNRALGAFMSMSEGTVQGDQS